MLTLKPMCFSRAAQGKLHTLLYSSPTHTEHGAAGEQGMDRRVGAQPPQPYGLRRQSPCPSPEGAWPQQSLDLSLELSKSPSHLPPVAPSGPQWPPVAPRAHSPHSLELWLSPAVQALGSAVCNCPVAPDPTPVPFDALRKCPPFDVHVHTYKGIVASIPRTNLKILLVPSLVTRGNECCSPSL